MMNSRGPLFYCWCIGIDCEWWNRSRMEWFRTLSSAIFCFAYLHTIRTSQTNGWLLEEWNECIHCFNNSMDNARMAVNERWRRKIGKKRANSFSMVDLRKQKAGTRAPRHAASNRARIFIFPYERIESINNIFYTWRWIYAIKIHIHQLHNVCIDDEDDEDFGDSVQHPRRRRPPPPSPRYNLRTHFSATVHITYSHRTSSASCLPASFLANIFFFFSSVLHFYINVAFASLRLTINPSRISYHSRTNAADERNGKEGEMRYRRPPCVWRMHIKIEIKEYIDLLNFPPYA